MFTFFLTTAENCFPTFLCFSLHILEKLVYFEYCFVNQKVLLFNKKINMIFRGGEKVVPCNI